MVSEPDLPLKISDGKGGWRHIGTVTSFELETGIAHGTVDDPLIQGALAGSLRLENVRLDREQLFAAFGVSSMEELEAIGPEPPRDCEYCKNPMPVDGYGSRYCAVCQNA